MDAKQGLAVWKAIRRHHPFFRAGGAFGFDWRTFHVCYPTDCAILRVAVAAAMERAS